MGTKLHAEEIRPYSIHWFRRDLRLSGNAALRRAWKATPGRVLGFFCFDRTFLARPDFSVSRFGFFLNTLHQLREDLRAQGGDLLVLDTGPDSAIETLLTTLRERGLPRPALWTYNRDYEPFARERDARIERLLNQTHGIPTHSERDHLIIEPRELLKDDGSFYQVYSPFGRKWLTLFDTEDIQSRVRAAAKSKPAESKSRFELTWEQLLGSSSSLRQQDALDAVRAEVLAKVTIPLPPAGERAASELLHTFKGPRLNHYATDRDIPGIPGTSRISIYLKNGSLTTAQVIQSLELTDGPRKKDSRARYLAELIWREFYYHILWHRPDVERQCFLTQYNALPWENSETHFSAWKEGRTGYPIVDAGMRELQTTGWMHNRVRMIVASFLTKDLLIDWRWGERYFMEALLDGDLAPNNGGWQWAASTGCDPQPYFRIFNPKLQSERFDPNGDYIRKFVPELRELSPDEIHDPITPPNGYPKKIVDHFEQKEKALALFKSVRGASAAN